MKDIMDRFKEECALMGIWKVREAANLAYLGLYAQQHRGQEGAGVSSQILGSGRHYLYKGLGLVSHVFEGFDFSRLPGNCAIGHVRYATAGNSTIAEVQPFKAHLTVGDVSIVQNGNLINASEIKDELVKEGCILSSTSDTELILHLLARNLRDSDETLAVKKTIKQIKGAFSLLIMFPDRLYAIRDPHGFRPLVLGALNDGYVLASETCAFDLLGVRYMRDIEVGEILEIKADNSHLSYKMGEGGKPAPCIFEYVYFARPDSHWMGISIYNARKNMGRELAREAPADVDCVIAVPDSGVPAAIGYAEELGKPFEVGLIRNHYIGRTFIEPKQSIRSFGVRIKHSPNHNVLDGKRIAVVDDSIVRGTTTKKLVAMIRSAGAKEVHLRVSSPPIVGPCFYGIDTPRKEKLIAHKMSVDEIRQYVNADSLEYLSLEGLYKATGFKFGECCDGCFTLNYPCGVPRHIEQREG